MFFESFWINSYPRSFRSFLHLITIFKNSSPQKISSYFCKGQILGSVCLALLPKFSMSKIGVSKTNDISINPAPPCTPHYLQKRGWLPFVFLGVVSLFLLQWFIVQQNLGQKGVRERRGIIQIMTVSAVYRKARPWSKAKLLLAMHFLALFLALFPSPLLLKDGSDMQEATWETW